MRTARFVIALALAVLALAACSKPEPESSAPAPADKAAPSAPAAAASPATPASPAAAASPAASASPATSATSAPLAASALASAARGGSGAAPTPSGSAAPAECGSKPLPDCPLQGWMKTNANPAVMANDLPALATALEKIVGFAPSGYTNWSSIAKDGAAAAKSGDLAAAKASCRSCHDQYKQKYKTEMRSRRI